MVQACILLFPLRGAGRILRLSCFRGSKVTSCAGRPVFRFLPHRESWRKTCTVQTKCSGTSPAASTSPSRTASSRRMAEGCRRWMVAAALFPKSWRNRGSHVPNFGKIIQHPDTEAQSQALCASCGPLPPACAFSLEVRQCCAFCALCRLACFCCPALLGVERYFLLKNDKNRRKREVCIYLLGLFNWFFCVFSCLFQGWHTSC